MQADEDYFLEIESRFATLRKTPFVFSAKDWALMKGWKEAGIPLNIILEALESCFAKRSEGGRKRVISSLSYCRHAVQELWNDRKELYVGRSGEVAPEHDPNAQLGQLASEVEEAAERSGGALGAILREAAEEVRIAGKGKSVPEIEESLLDLEQALIEKLVASLSPDDAAAIEASVSAQVAGMKSADEKTIERTRRANFKRIVRERCGIPRLSLFR